MVTCAIVHVIALELKMWSIGTMVSLFLVTTIMNWWRWHLTEDHQMWQLRCSCLETWGEGASCPCRRGGGWHDRSLGLGDIDQKKTKSLEERCGGLFVHAGEKRVDNKYLEAVATDHPHCEAWSRLQETNRTTFAPLTPREYQVIFWNTQIWRSRIFSGFPHLLVSF